MLACGVEAGGEDFAGVSCHILVVVGVERGDEVTSELHDRCLESTCAWHLGNCLHQLAFLEMVVQHAIRASIGQ